MKNFIDTDKISKNYLEIMNASNSINDNFNKMIELIELIPNKFSDKEIKKTCENLKEKQIYEIKRINKNFVEIANLFNQLKLSYELVEEKFYNNVGE